MRRVHNSVGDRLYSLIWWSALLAAFAAAYAWYQPAEAATGTGEPWCNYEGPDGGIHPTEVEGAVAVLCSDGSSYLLRERPVKLPRPVSAYFDLADVLSTFWGIEFGGLSEANPIMRPFTESNLGYVAMFGVKAATLAWSRSKPPAQCTTGLRISNAVKATAACSNIALGISVLADVTISAGAALATFAAVCGYPAWKYSADSARAECEEGVPSFLITRRAQSRLQDIFNGGR